jgi:hypothetical protein
MFLSQNRLAVETYMILGLWLLNEFEFQKPQLCSHATPWLHG